jgi:hypothetical protein
MRVKTEAQRTGGGERGCGSVFKDAETGDLRSESELERRERGEMRTYFEKRRSEWRNEIRLNTRLQFSVADWPYIALTAYK